MQETRTRNKEGTKARLIDAATAEFAEFGIAGARVDRIATQARANKAQIYHYFGSKDDLFDAVYGALAERIVSATPLDAGDLPGYAVALSRAGAEHPEISRLTAWYRLERGAAHGLVDRVVQNSHAKIKAIATAQRDGLVNDHYPPEVLLILVTHLSSLWDSQVPEYQSLVFQLPAARRDQIVREAVAALVQVGARSSV